MIEFLCKLIKSVKMGTVDPNWPVDCLHQCNHNVVPDSYQEGECYGSCYPIEAFKAADPVNYEEKTEFMFFVACSDADDHVACAVAANATAFPVSPLVNPPSPADFNTCYTKGEQALGPQGIGYWKLPSDPNHNDAISAAKTNCDNLNLGLKMPTPSEVQSYWNPLIFYSTQFRQLSNEKQQCAINYLVDAEPKGIHTAFMQHFDLNSFKEGVSVCPKCTSNQWLNGQCEVDDWQELWDEFQADLSLLFLTPEYLTVVGLIDVPLFATQPIWRSVVITLAMIFAPISFYEFRLALKAAEEYYLTWCIHHAGLLALKDPLIVGAVGLALTTLISVGETQFDVPEALVGDVGLVGLGVTMAAMGITWFSETPLGEGITDIGSKITSAIGWLLNP